MNETRTIANELLLGEISRDLSRGKRVRMRAKGGSMRPFIRGKEDILLLAPAETLRKGDVALARIDGRRYVVHRIVEIRGDGITLMGDGNLYETESCGREEIFGTVESLIRKGRVRGMRSPYALLKARIWRLMLPLRRLRMRIIKRVSR